MSCICESCGSSRVAKINGKCNDCFHIGVGKKSHDGYVPRDIGIGGSDYISFSYCLDCGKIQGDFPLAPTKVETKEEEEDESYL